MPLSSTLAKRWGPGAATPGSSAILAKLESKEMPSLVTLETYQPSCPYPVLKQSDGLKGRQPLEAQQCF